MDYKNSIICQVIPEVDMYSKLCTKLLKENTWSETIIDLTQSISDYKNSEENLDDLAVTFEVFFILESSIIKIANEPISEFSAKLNSSDYSEYMHLYIMNEITHAKFYRNLYRDIVLHDKILDEEHVMELYNKYNNIEHFARRVSSIENTLTKNRDVFYYDGDINPNNLVTGTISKTHEMNWRDFVNLGATEGVKFMSGFYNIFYYSRNGLLLAVGEGNRWVSVDELIHATNHFFTSNYLRKQNNISTSDYLDYVISTITDFVDDEIEFSINMYPHTSGTKMFRYIKWLGQKLLSTVCDICNVPNIIIYDDAKLPIYMATLELAIKESLHETINTNYAKIDKISFDLDKLSSGIGNFKHLNTNEIIHFG